MLLVLGGDPGCTACARSLVVSQIRIVAMPSEKPAVDAASPLIEIMGLHCIYDISNKYDIIFQRYIFDGLHGQVSIKPRPTAEYGGRKKNTRILEEMACTLCAVGVAGRQK